MAILFGLFNIVSTLLVLQIFLIHFSSSYSGDDDEPIPSDYYALEIRGGRKLAEMVASAHGFRVVREVGYIGWQSTLKINLLILFLICHSSVETYSSFVINYLDR